MGISGLQKLTLLDYPGHIACTIFTSGCNYRCPFCHNASLVLRPQEQVEISETELFDFLQKRIGILQGVCITGGEPTLYQGLPSLLDKIKHLGYLIKLDTNGSAPSILKELIHKKVVDYVAMDIKNSKEKYGITCGIQTYDISPVEESVSFLKEGHIPYEFRTTIVKEFHTKEDFIAIGHWLEGAGRYFLQNFKDSGDLISQGLNEIPKQDLMEFKSLLTPYIKHVEIRGLS